MSKDYFCGKCGQKKVREAGEQKRLACKPCKAEYSKNYRDRHSDRLKAHKLAEHAASPWKRKDRMLRKNYGITLEVFTAMKQEQGGVCKVCGEPETSIHRGKVMELSVDHCHSTGKVRGLLCSGCNTALGLLRENTLIINSLVQYIEASK